MNFVDEKIGSQAGFVSLLHRLELTTACPQEGIAWWAHDEQDDYGVLAIHGGRVMRFVVVRDV